MSLERINIGEGINISFVESDRFKKNLVCADIITRLEDDPKASKNALLAKVLMRGSKNYPTMADISRRLNQLYAAMIGCFAVKVGEAQILSFSADMLADKYALDDTNITDETLDVFFDILINPLLEEGEEAGFVGEYVKSEKTNLIDEIKAQINDKNAYAYNKCVEAMCAGERFATQNCGTISSVEQIDPKSLYDHYKYILSSCAIEIFCVGSFAEKKERITQKFAEMLKGIERKKPEELECYETDVVLSAKFKGEITEEMEVNQAKLAMGFRAGVTNKENDEFLKFVLFDTVFATAPTGKLFCNLREKLSLCYYCYTVSESAKGIVTVLCGIESENKDQATEEILRQLEEIKNGNFTDSDIEAAKKADITAYKGIFDSAGAIVGWYRNRLLCDNPKTPEQAIEEILKLKKSDIVEAAKKLSLDTIYFLKGAPGGEESEIIDEIIESEEER